MWTDWSYKASIKDRTATFKQGGRSACWVSSKFRFPCFSDLKNGLRPQGQLWDSKLYLTVSSFPGWTYLPTVGNIFAECRDLLNRMKPFWLENIDNVQSSFGWFTVWCEAHFLKIIIIGFRIISSWKLTLSIITDGMVSWNSFLNNVRKIVILILRENIQCWTALFRIVYGRNGVITF